MNDWPELPYLEWRDTCATLQLWTQIVGKIRLTLAPWLNHSWHVPLYVTSRGLGTSPIPYRGKSFEIDFDFQAHLLDVRVSDGAQRRVALRPKSVAEFHSEVMTTLRTLGIDVSIVDLPCEIPDAIPFTQDTQHAAYDADAVQRFWRILVQVDRLMHEFRTAFLGKSSPVHFFWGSFDLAVTRFSGRTAPAYTGKVPGLATAVMAEAYSHEVSSAGFWPGGGGVEYAAFYSYAYPEPAGFSAAKVEPATAGYNSALGQFLLPYEAVRTDANPDAAVLAFFSSTYAAAADLGKWDRAALDCTRGRAGVPRRV